MQVCGQTINKWLSVKLLCGMHEQGPYLLPAKPEKCYEMHAGIVDYERIVDNHPTRKVQLHIYDTCIERCALASLLW